MTPSPWFRAAASALVAAVLPACDGVVLNELQPGRSTTTEVRSRLGEPTAEYTNPDGSLTWEYARQPNGVECHMLTFGSDLILQKREQVLTEANQAKIQAGWDKDQVRRLLGKPGTITPYRNLGEEVWDWRVAGTLPTEEAHFHVHFDLESGLVRKTSRRVEPKG